MNRQNTDPCTRRRTPLRVGAVFGLLALGLAGCSAATSSSSGSGESSPCPPGTVSTKHYEISDVVSDEQALLQGNGWAVVKATLNAIKAAEHVPPGIGYAEFADVGYGGNSGITQAQAQQDGPALTTKAGSELHAVAYPNLSKPFKAAPQDLPGTATFYFVPTVACL